MSSAEAQPALPGARPPAALPRAAAHAFVADLGAPDLADDDRHHLERVLRLRPGEAVTVSDGTGGWRPCRFGAGGRLEPDGDARCDSRPAPTLTVGFAPTKGDRPEWVVQKLTEAGVDRIVVLTTARAVVRWEGERAGRHAARLRKVAREAAMQSRRTWLPVVQDAPVLAPLVAELDGRCALAEAGGGPPSLERPAVLVGPEGGWSDEERALVPAHVALGPHVLRAETAAVAAGLVLAALRSGLVRAIS